MQDCRFVIGKDTTDIMRKLTAAALAVAACALTAAPAQAAGKQCSRKATVTSGTVLSMSTATVAEDGTQQLDPTPQKKLNGIMVYTSSTAAKVKYQKVVYTLEAGAVFGLSCFGHSVAEGAKFPLITLYMGKATVKFRNGRPGAVSAGEGLWDPYQEKAMTMTVTRTPKGKPTVDEVLQKGQGALMLGTVKVRKMAGKGYLNVTPYVGRKPGVCRQAKGGTFVSKRLAGGYLKGTSKFTSLAPFSAR